MTKIQLVEAINDLMLTEKQRQYRRELSNGYTERIVFLPPRNCHRFAAKRSSALTP